MKFSNKTSLYLWPCLLLSPVLGYFYSINYLQGKFSISISILFFLIAFMIIVSIFGLIYNSILGHESGVNVGKITQFNQVRSLLDLLEYYAGVSHIAGAITVAGITFYCLALKGTSFELGMALAVSASIFSGFLYLFVSQLLVDLFNYRSKTTKE
ncbi:hypothetical protein [Halobacteriovorax sp. CON-3]|uniref:hypothetical protein n=1 Tax=Halobacteriovorax sp. CON-3 TaxID=3157710 RepID=UPI0037167FF3